MDNNTFIKKVNMDMKSNKGNSIIFEMMKTYGLSDNIVSESVSNAITNNGGSIITSAYSRDLRDRILIVENEDSILRLKVRDCQDDKRIIGGGCVYDKQKSPVDKESLINIIKLFDSYVDTVSVRNDGNIIIKTVTTVPTSKSKVLPEYLDKNCPSYVLDNKSDNRYAFKKCDEESDMIDEMKRSELPDEVFGIPQERKYPMPDKKHVYSAIKLFGHVEPKYEKQLANKIKKKMKEYGISKDEVGEKNKLKKYL